MVGIDGTERGTRVRRITPWPTALLVVAFAVAGCAQAGVNRPPEPAIPVPADSASPTEEPDKPLESSPETVGQPERTVEESGGFRLAALSSSRCTADGPADWAMQAPDRSDRADVYSQDGSMYAGYGIQAINTALQGFAYAYEPPLNDPALYSEEPAAVARAYATIVVAGIGGSSDLAVDEIIQPTPDYLLMSAATSTHRGAVFFRASGFAGDGVNYSYALPMYFAFTTLDRWAAQGLLVARVAASIRCSTQFQPPDDYPIVEAAVAGDAVDENGEGAGYNPQLGTEPVHDPTTGTNYLVDPSVNWSETGPDGPGYYVPKGDDYVKLEPGRFD